jgi:uncharacterized protein (DUF1919 family)
LLLDKSREKKQRIRKKINLIKNKSLFIMYQDQAEFTEEIIDLLMSDNLAESSEVKEVLERALEKYNNL